MEPFNALLLFLLPNVPSSYSNMWWAQAIKESMSRNEGVNLRVLDETHLSMDRALTRDKQYISYPTFNTCVEPGFYHINISASNHLFTGFINIVSNDEAFWWGTDATDKVFAGFAGHTDKLNNHSNGYTGEMINWLGSITYSDSFKLNQDIHHILKPF